MLIFDSSIDNLEFTERRKKNFFNLSLCKSNAVYDGRWWFNFEIITLQRIFEAKVIRTAPLVWAQNNIKQRRHINFTFDGLFNYFFSVSFPCIDCYLWKENEKSTLERKAFTLQRDKSLSFVSPQRNETSKQEVYSKVNRTSKEW